jgi:hypothetical protein
VALKGVTKDLLESYWEEARTGLEFGIRARTGLNPRPPSAQKDYQGKAGSPSVGSYPRKAFFRYDSPTT